MPTAHLHAPQGVPRPLFPSLKSNRALKPLCRRSRRAFHPSAEIGPYCLPKPIQERLTVSLTGFRNAEASFLLAIFLARFWSSPGRLENPFPIDRRALANHRELPLSESQIRGAILTLERIGFLNRAVPVKGSSYRRKGDELHRKAVLFTFGEEYGPSFRKANERSRRKRQRPSVVPRTLPLPALSSPKDRISLGRGVIMGEVAPHIPSEQSPLELALARLQKAGGFGSG